MVKIESHGIEEFRLQAYLADEPIFFRFRIFVARARDINFFAHDHTQVLLQNGLQDCVNIADREASLAARPQF